VPPIVSSTASSAPVAGPTGDGVAASPATGSHPDATAPPTSGDPDGSGARAPRADFGVPGGLGGLGGPAEPWWHHLRPSALVPLRPLDKGLVRLVTVAVLAAVVGAGAVWAGSGDGGPPASVGASLPMATRRPAPGTTGGPAPSPGTTAGAAWVAIAGAVVRPGLYRVASDTRLSSLIAAAGGLAGDADADRVNLAAAVRDGERVYVPRRGEPGAPPVVAGADPGAAVAPGGSAAAGAGGAGASASGPLDLNRASADELDRLPGVGPATARAIIDHRSAKGPFTSVDQLADVRGIGPAKLDQLRPLVVV
jgi:competence protein ComEA